ncbi:hypothetical protein SAMN05421594_2872 [Chryseobacterium oleae]|uniref:Uncharacterized protein n=1 Tax=Chryseobacterium oleae TaxID=491207 RepID=A0A1I4ZCD2_CHROL|nr:hypothetical protein SAMN05421594_2872 [Chryseobacterium oleae]
MKKMTNVPIIYVYSKNSGFREGCKTNNNTVKKLGAGTFIF